MLMVLLIVFLAWARAALAADTLERIDNGTVTVGIDRAKGGAIAWLSWRGHPGNAINTYDPGRLIQQSYYAGRSLDRTADGQHDSWSPWPWNPIQAGGVEGWATVRSFRRDDDGRMVTETAGKLWDMPDEDAAAVIRQTTGFMAGLDNVVALECAIACRRPEDDRWGPPVPRHQELPACYLTRSFDRLRTYLGDGRWRDEEIPPGPPWGRVEPPLRVLACFNAHGQGIAIWSPEATDAWNVGPHGDGAADDPTADPCVHVAPLATARLGPRSVYRYRAWVIVGEERTIAAALGGLLSARGETFQHD